MQFRRPTILETFLVGWGKGNYGHMFRRLLQFLQKKDRWSIWIEKWFQARRQTISKQYVENKLQFWVRLKLLSFRSELTAQFSTKIGNLKKRPTLQIGAKVDMLALFPSLGGVVWVTIFWLNDLWFLILYCHKMHFKNTYKLHIGNQSSYTLFMKKTMCNF